MVKMVILEHADKILLMRANQFLVSGYLGTIFKMLARAGELNTENLYKLVKEDLSREFQTNRIDRNKDFLWVMLNFERSKRLGSRFSKDLISH